MLEYNIIMIYKKIRYVSETLTFVLKLQTIAFSTFSSDSSLKVTSRKRHYQTIKLKRTSKDPIFALK